MAIPSAKHLTKLMGSKVLVLGGSTGIGYSVAESALQHGARVVISSSNSSKLDEALKRLRQAYSEQASGPARFLLVEEGRRPEEAVRGQTCDLADAAKIEDSVESLLRFAADGGPLDHVVFTAGNAFSITHPRDTSVSAIHDTMMVRSTAPIIVAKYLEKYVAMSPHSSYTITGGSNSLKPQPDWSILAGASAAVEGLARGLAVDLKPLRVNCVSPGAVNTEIFSRVPEERRGALLETFKKATTTGRVALAEDLAEAYLFCMRSRDVTGSVIDSNGGRLLV